MSAPVLVLISSKSEWRVVKAFYPQSNLQTTPYGEWCEVPHASADLIFCQGGVGKVSAAASTDYAIHRWQPGCVINLGTCGGIAGMVQVGEIVLAQKTVIYDIYEQMGDPAAAIARYTTEIDLSWLPQPYPIPVHPVTLVSADRDLMAVDIPALRQHYTAVVADWESGAIAWVAARHHLPTLILRGVTDLVNNEGGEAYGNIEQYHTHTPSVMERLLRSLPDWLS